MADVDNELRLKTHFTDLVRLERTGDFNRALKVSNKILNESPHNAKAFHCRIVCLIQLNKFDEAISATKKYDKLVEDCGELCFERAYCYYRLNKPEEAANVLMKIENIGNRERELLAQIYYKLENFEESLNHYKYLVKNTHDDFENERKTNLAATISSMALINKSKEFDLVSDTYEVIFNEACYLVNSEKYVAAIEKLKDAEKLCRAGYEDDPDSVDEMNSELTNINVQMGYALQKIGKSDEALQLYNQVTKQKHDDFQLSAVASNNIICINKDQNVFDSKKKLKILLTENQQSKLTKHQKSLINLNHCLLLYFMNQLEMSKRQSEELKKNETYRNAAILIQACAFLKEKQITKAIDLLKSEINNGNSDRKIALALSQMFILSKKLEEACNVLKNIKDLSIKPGIISTLVVLYLANNDIESAATVLEGAVEYYKNNDENSTILMDLVTFTAHFHLKYTTPERAVMMLEYLHKQDPKNQQIIAQLIVAYSKFDQIKAKKLSLDLPMSDEKFDFDVENLETTVGSFGNKFIKKVSSKSDQSPRFGSAKSSSSLKSNEDKNNSEKKKKKRRGKLPKGLGTPGNADPERWLPLKERSYYRGRRKNKKKDIGKGSQGVSAAQVHAAGLQLDASKNDTSGTTDTAIVKAPVPLKPVKAGSGGKQQKKRKKGK